MKKFYLAAVVTIGFLCIAFVSNAQTVYRTVNGGTVASPLDLAAPANWLGLPFAGQPPNGVCTDCKVIVDCICLINPAFTAPLTFNGTLSEIDILKGASLEVDQYIQLDNAKIIIGSDATTAASLIVNDEIDLTGTSSVRLANNNTFIDATNAIANPIHGPIAPNPSISGFAGILVVTNPVTFPAVGSYDYLVSLGGYGNPAFAPPVTPPGIPGTDRFFDPYVINCGVFPVIPFCASGLIYGPATSGFDAAYGINSFAASAPLPVTLVQFIASRNDDQTIKVSWATAQEENASHFDVERTGDAGAWETIGTVKAKGFSSITTNYTYTDLYPLSGTNYYRLKMVDLDGKFKYSKVVSVSSNTKGESLVIYNNPFTDLIRLKVNTASADNLNLMVTDMLGKVYLSQSYKARAGDNFININPAGASGLYILHIQGKTYDKTVKLVKE